MGRERRELRAAKLRKKLTPSAFAESDGMSARPS